jgi:protease II
MLCEGTGTKVKSLDGGEGGRERETERGRERRATKATWSTCYANMYGVCQQAMLHVLGNAAAEDRCLMEETREGCFVTVTGTKDGALILLNCNSKTSAEVRPPTCESGAISFTFLQREDTEMI